MADKPKLLIVDDDPKLRTLLGQFLEKSGYQVTSCESGNAALETLKKHTFSLVVLDVMMPGLSGVDVVTQMRERADKTPVLMLTALGDVEDRIKGLSKGADDYLPKPFDTRELLLRIEKQLVIPEKRTEQQEGLLHIGEFSFDRARKVLSREGHVVALTTSEENLLCALAKAPGDPVSRDQLATDAGCGLSPRTIDVQINRLRRKLEDNEKPSTLIKTVRHQGYALMVT